MQRTTHLYSSITVHLGLHFPGNPNPIHVSKGRVAVMHVGLTVIGTCWGEDNQHTFRNDQFSNNMSKYWLLVQIKQIRSEASQSKREMTGNCLGIMMPSYKSDDQRTDSEQHKLAALYSKPSAMREMRENTARSRVRCLRHCLRFDHHLGRSRAEQQVRARAVIDRRVCDDKPAPVLVRVGTQTRETPVMRTSRQTQTPCPPSGPLAPTPTTATPATSHISNNLQPKVLEVFALS